VEVTSAEGAGSRFTVHLPVKPAEAMKAVSPVEPAASRETPVAMAADGATAVSGQDHGSSGLLSCGSMRRVGLPVFRRRLTLGHSRSERQLANLWDVAGQISQRLTRIFLRDENPDLMDQFLKGGVYRSIPVIAFFDEHMNELARFIERRPS